MDDHIKNKIKQHASDLDIQFEWGRIEEHYKKKRRRKFLFFLFFMGGISLFIYVNRNVIKEDQSQIAALDKALDIESQIAKNGLVNTSEHLICDTVNYNNVIYSNEKVDQKKLAVESTRIPQQSINSPLHRSKTMVTSNPDFDSVDEIIDQKSRTHQSEETTLSDVSIVKNDLKENEEIVLSPISTLIPTFDDLASNTEINPHLILPKVQVNWTVTALARNMSIYDKNKFETLLNASNENILTSVETKTASYFITLNRQLNSKISVFGGARVDFITEDISINYDLSESFILNNQVIEILRSFNGSSTTLIGNQTAINNKSLAMKAANNYTVIQIPVGLNYKFDIGKSNFEWGGGMNIPFLKSISGYTIDKSLLPSKLENSDISLKPTFFTSINYNIPLSSKIHFLMGLEAGTTSVNFNYIGKNIGRSNSYAGLLFGFKYIY